MDDQTGIDLHERGKYSEDHREYHEGDGDTPEEMPIERHVTNPKPARSPRLCRSTFVTRDDAADFLRNRARNVLAGTDGQRWHDREAAARALNIAATVLGL